jgi:hypothetical protein
MIHPPTDYRVLYASIDGSQKSVLHDAPRVSVRDFYIALWNRDIIRIRPEGSIECTKGVFRGPHVSVHGPSGFFFFVFFFFFCYYYYTVMTSPCSPIRVSLGEFLTRAKIRFMAITMDPVEKIPRRMLDVTDPTGQATVIPTFNNLRVNHPHSWTQERLDKHNEVHSDTELICIDTSEIAQVDFDDGQYCVTHVETDPVLVAGGPAFLSANKRLPHCFVRLPAGIKGTLGVRRTIPHAKADLLCGQWSIAKRTENVLCPDKDIPWLPLDYLINQAGITTAIDQMDIGDDIGGDGGGDDNDYYKPYDQLPYVPVPKGIRRTIDEFESLVAMISPARAAAPEPEWFAVGAALKAAARFFQVGDDVGLRHWLEFSAKCPAKYDMTSAIAKWTRLGCVGKPGFKALRSIASADSPGDYTAKFGDPLLGDDSAAAATDLASIDDTFYHQTDVGFYMGKHFLQDKVMSRRSTDSTSKIQTYFYDGNRWKPVNHKSVYDIFVIQLKEHYQAFVDMYGDLEVYRQECLDNGTWHNHVLEHPEVLADKFNHPMAIWFPKITGTNLTKLWDKCFDGSKNASFMTSLIGGTVDNARAALLDTNRFLIGCNNGIIDLTVPGTVTFRRGSPIDHVSMTTGYDYYDPKIHSQSDRDRMDQIRSEVADLFKSLFVDPLVHDYFMDINAYALVGENWIEHFIVHTGRGSNGKSLIASFLHKIYGEYATTIKNSLVIASSIGTGSANGHDSEAMKTDKKRYVYAKEIPADVKMQVAVIKEMTGGEVISARAIYGAAGEIEPNYTLNLFCNNVPIMDAVDGGIIRRLRVIDYPVQFVPNLPADEATETKKCADPGLRAKLNQIEYIQQGLRILLEIYQQRIRPGQVINVPASVLNEANQVISESDPKTQLVSDGLLLIAPDADRLGPHGEHHRSREWRIKTKDLKALIVGARLASPSMANKFINNIFHRAEYTRSTINLQTGTRSSTMYIYGLKMTEDGEQLVAQTAGHLSGQKRPREEQ